MLDKTSHKNATSLRKFRFAYRGSAISLTSSRKHSTSSKRATFIFNGPNASRTNDSWTRYFFRSIHDFRFYFLTLRLRKIISSIQYLLYVIISQYCTAIISSTQIVQFDEIWRIWSICYSFGKLLLGSWMD